MENKYEKSHWSYRIAGTELQAAEIVSYMKKKYQMYYVFNTTDNHFNGKIVSKHYIKDNLENLKEKYEFIYSEWDLGFQKMENIQTHIEIIKLSEKVKGHQIFEHNYWTGIDAKHPYLYTSNEKWERMKKGTLPTLKDVTYTTEQKSAIF